MSFSLSLLPLVRRRRPSHISDRRRRRVAMVSWFDDDSSENSHQYADSASDEGITKVSCSSSS